MQLVPPSACLYCGRMNDAATSVEDGEPQPEPGDLSLCAYCGYLMAFDDDLKLRELTKDEMISAAGDARIIEASDVIARIQRRSK